MIDDHFFLKKCKSLLYVNNFFFNFSFELSEKKNRSLYDELKATSLYPRSFETSSEFMKFDNLKIDSNSEENKSEESSLENKFKNDELGFKNNSTKEERHILDEATFDEQSLKYSSIIVNKTDDEGENEKRKTTALPILLTTAKKGKYLDLIPRGGDNINASIPNAAEVWALAGMRDLETRRPFDESDESSSDVELLGSSLNNTAKNLLDWIEIAKMNNETLARSSSNEENQTEDFNIAKSTVMNDISIDEDPATSENNDVGIFVSSLEPAQTSSTLKPTIEENGIYLDTGNGEFGGENKSNANSRIDSEVFGKSQEEREESAIELIDPFKQSDHRHNKERLRINDVEIKNDLPTTTESNEGFTTEMTETTTMENYETTTSIVDTFTVIGEDEDADDIFKRTITEVPSMATERPDVIISTTQSTQATIDNDQVHMELVQDTTTEVPNTSLNEIPESTQNYNKSTTVTKSFSFRVVTTTESPGNEAEPTIDNESLSSTLVPKFRSSQQPFVTTHQQNDTSLGTSSSTVEIIDDDKFKYSTILPETTTEAAFTIRGKNEDFNEPTSAVVTDTLNKENLDGEQGGSSLGIISASISVVVVLILAVVGYVSLKLLQPGLHLKILFSRSY